MPSLYSVPSLQGKHEPWGPAAGPSWHARDLCGCTQALQLMQTCSTSSHTSLLAKPLAAPARHPGGHAGQGLFYPGRTLSGSTQQVTGSS